MLRDSSSSSMSQQFFLQGAEEIALNSLEDALEVLLAGE